MNFHLLSLHSFLEISKCSGNSYLKVEWSGILICSWIFNKHFLFSLHSPVAISGWTDEEANKDKASAKKRRVETFQQKEKRKRDMGQATSDKTFVEEEKRILRQKLEWSWINKVSHKDFFSSV